MKIIKSDYFKKNVIKFKDDWNDIVDNHIDSDGYSPFNKIIKYKIIWDKTSKVYIGYGYYDTGGNNIINKNNNHINPKY